MSEAQAQVKNLHSVVLQRVRIAGKIQNVRRHDGNIYTQIIAPAKDEYSRPSTYELRSKERLGEKDDVVNVDCEVSGTSRPFTYMDKESGERKTGFDNKVFLEVI